MWKASEALMEKITHYSTFPATGVSLRQMVQFGQNPSAGELSLVGNQLRAAIISGLNCSVVLTELVC